MDDKKLYRIILIGTFLLAALAIIGYVAVKVGNQMASGKTVPVSVNDTTVTGTSPADNDQAQPNTTYSQVQGTNDPALSGDSADQPKPVLSIKPLKPNKENVNYLIGLGFSKADATFICKYVEPADLNMNSDEWLKNYAMKKAKVVEAQFNAPNAYLVDQDLVAYIQTRGYTEKQARSLIDNWSVHKQEALFDTNADFDALLKNDK